MQSVQSEIALQPVFLDMDGSIDDLLSLITLLALPNFRLTGVSVTNGNCYSENAVESILRIFRLFEINNIKVAISNAKPLNPFPSKWREKSKLFNQLDIIKKFTPGITEISESEAAEFMAQKILAEEGKTIIVLTGPATNLSNAIETYPELKEKIEKILWMAGAFFENGNVISPDHDGSAEWNIFWDPISAQKLIRTGLKIVLFPLDVCNQVPVDNYLMYLLKKQSKYKLSKMISTILEQLIVDHSSYSMWDVVPSMVLGFPDIVRISNTSIDIEIRGTSKGNIFKTSKGSPIYFASSIDDEKFYTDFANLMKTI
jgi:purine nucleosidase